MLAEPSSSRDRSASGTKVERDYRRPVRMEGHARVEDGSTFAISILDLTYDGCRIRTGLALLPGLRLKISVLGLGRSLDATVRWYSDGKAGLEFGVAQAAREHKERRYERTELAAELSIRRPGRSHYQCRLFDVTPCGCKVEFIERPRTGEMVWVKFDGLNAIEAAVRWVDGYYGGLEFVQPIYPAVFDMLLLRLQG